MAFTHLFQTTAVSQRWCVAIPLQRKHCGNLDHWAQSLKYVCMEMYWHGTVHKPCNQR